MASFASEIPLALDRSAEVFSNPSPMAVLFRVFPFAGLRILLGCIFKLGSVVPFDHVFGAISKYKQLTPQGAPELKAVAAT